MSEQTHAHTIIQVVCCWIQTEKWKKKQKTNNFNNKNKCNFKRKESKVSYYRSGLMKLLNLKCLLFSNVFLFLPYISTLFK